MGFVSEERHFQACYPIGTSWKAMEFPPHHPMRMPRPTLTCSSQVPGAGAPPCLPRPAEGSSTLPSAIGQRGGREGAGLPGQPARMCWVGHDCIVGREARTPQGRTPGTTSCCSTPAVGPPRYAGTRADEGGGCRGPGMRGAPSPCVLGPGRSHGSAGPTSPDGAKALRRHL